MTKFAPLFLLIPSIAMGSCGIADVLPIIRPSAEWNLRGSSYAGLEWLDKTQVKPTQKEIDAALQACLLDEQAKAKAKIDLNTTTKTDAERIDAIIKYLGLDK